MQLQNSLSQSFLTNKIITTKQAEELGVSKTLMSRYVKSGLLERVEHGVYALPGSAYDDMYVLGERSSFIIFSHDTALFLNGLSDRTPFMHSVTIPSNKSLTRKMKEECICYYIKPDLYEIGITTKKTTFGNVVKCYDAERTVCDILRSRNRLDEETVISAIKNYAQSKQKDLNKLGLYAGELRVANKLKQYMEVLL